MDQGSIPPSLPFRLAAVYGGPATQARHAVPVAPGRGTPRVLNDLDTVELSAPRRAAAETTGARRLVAAAVRVPVDFDVAPVSTAAARDTLAMYRHPADKNAAATAVNVGRAVDVTA